MLCIHSPSTFTTAASNVGLTTPDGFSKCNLTHPFPEYTDKARTTLTEHVWRRSQLSVDTSGLILGRTLSPPSYFSPFLLFLLLGDKDSDDDFMKELPRRDSTTHSVR